MAYPENTRIALSLAANRATPTVLCSMNVDVSPDWNDSISLKEEDQSTSESPSSEGTPGRAYWRMIQYRHATGKSGLRRERGRAN